MAALDGASFCLFFLGGPRFRAAGPAAGAECRAGVSTITRSRAQTHSRDRRSLGAQAGTFHQAGFRVPDGKRRLLSGPGEPGRFAVVLPLWTRARDLLHRSRAGVSCARQPGGASLISVASLQTSYALRSHRHCSAPDAAASHPITRKIGACWGPRSRRASRARPECADSAFLLVYNSEPEFPP